jgi:hypothetical protein
MKARGLLFLLLCRKAPSLDGASVVTNIEILAFGHLRERMEALAVERPHTPIIKPHGEETHESRFFVVGDLADTDILITTASIPEFTKVLKDNPG